MADNKPRDIYSEPELFIRHKLAEGLFASRRDIEQITAGNSPALFGRFEALCKRIGFSSTPPLFIYSSEYGLNAAHDFGCFAIHKTWLSLLTPEEIDAVLLHEIGHEVLPQNVNKQTLEAVLGALLLFTALAPDLDLEHTNTAFKSHSKPLSLSRRALLGLGGAGLLSLSSLKNYTNEDNADKYALNHLLTENLDAYASALEKKIAWEKEHGFPESTGDGNHRKEQQRIQMIKKWSMEIKEQRNKDHGRH